MKSLYILCVLLFLITCRVHDAEADFYVIAGAGGKPVGTEIKSLPAFLSSSGFYYVSKDLNSQGGGVTIEADNVTLDLMGFSLIGPSGQGQYNGIDIGLHLGVEIRNGTVRNFPDFGVLAGSARSRIRLFDIRVINNGSSGIKLVGTYNTVVRCQVIENGGDGIFTGSGSTVSGNIAYDNGSGGIEAGNGSIVKGNTANYNGSYGIFAGSGTIVSDNIARFNGTRGIYASIGSTVSGNIVSYNSTNGIVVSQGATVSGNTSTHNGRDGIIAGMGSTVTNNTSSFNSDSGYYGIYLVGENYVDQNTCYGNDTNIKACANCTFGTNHAP